LEVIVVSEIKVMASAAFKEAYLELVPEFERTTGHKVVTIWIPTVEIMQRLKGGEIVDIVILAADAIDGLIKLGKLAHGSRVDLAKSGVAAAVRAGAPKPDISSGEALKRSVLAAKSIVYSHGPSGIYLADLFQRMGIAEQLKPKVKLVQGEPAGAVVARGEAEIGFQQVSELIHVPGIDFVGALPAELQPGFSFAGAISRNAKEPEAAMKLLLFLASPGSAATITKAGLAPVPAR
jgi:molybdate transport system substrate-binding protein